MPEQLDYALFIDNAMRGAVREMLRQVQRSGLPGQNHFFISYRTDYPGVAMSDSLRAKYPNEITIVLQHQFWDLVVDDDQFRVSLSFSNIPEKLVVPFAALTGFADPSTKFGLQFHSIEVKGANESQIVEEVPVITTPFAQNSEDEIPQESSKVIALDAFRKK